MASDAPPAVLLYDWDNTLAVWFDRATAVRQAAACQA